MPPLQAVPVFMAADLHGQIVNALPNVGPWFGIEDRSNLFATAR